MDTTGIKSYSVRTESFAVTQEAIDLAYVGACCSFFRSLGEAIERKAVEARWAANAVKLPAGVVVRATRRGRR